MNDDEDESVTVIGLKQAAVEAKAMLAHILSNYSVSTPQKLEDIKMSYEIVCMPYPKLKLKFIPRPKHVFDAS
jgi:hypothetical protein